MDDGCCKLVINMNGSKYVNVKELCYIWKGVLKVTSFDM